MHVTDQNMDRQSPAAIKRRQLILIGMLLAGIAILTGLAWQTVTAMVATWSGVSAYKHGYFILPIALFMAWESRHRLAGLVLEPFWPGLILVAGFALVWLVARSASIMEGEQIGYVGMIQGLMLTLLGRKIIRAQILPFLYLWLMVPSGGFLLPFLQTIATWLAVHFLQLTSIPFFTDQYYIELPVGLFFVAPGCAGLNFLLAALALSVVYAELLYVGWKRKLVCILVWLGVAVLANGFRIFAILWLAQITDKRLAIVDDHLLYGWGFFFLILIGLMVAGRRFSNMPPLPADSGQLDWAPAGAAPIAKFAKAGAAAIFIIVSVLGYGLAAFSAGERLTGLDISAPDRMGNWQKSEDAELAHGAFPNADARHGWLFSNGQDGLNFFTAYYAAQWDGHEAAADSNTIFGTSAMKPASVRKHEVVLGGVRHRVREEAIKTSRNDFLIWRWYCADGNFVADALDVRKRAAVNGLMMRQTPAFVFALVSRESPEARAAMTAFLEAAAPPAEMNVVNAKGASTAPAVCW